MGLFVKICGLARAEDVEAVAACAPDAMGFVFWPRSPRAVTPEEVRVWTRDLDPSITKVGVFVDQPAEEIRRAVEVARLDVVQWHGREKPERLAEVKTPAWKALHLDRVTDNDVKGYHVDAFLVDSYSAEAPGGTGKVVDWERAAAFIQSQPVSVLLAGGLTAENVAGAVRQTQPWGVDVSSGVEARPGEKDHNQVKAFIEQCRNC